MKESEFQKSVIDELYSRFPGCIVLKNDAKYKQGIPDLSVFYKNKYAFLEVKDSADAHRQPNQEHYISKINDMSFARFIFPENKEEVLNELESAFGKR